MANVNFDDVLKAIASGEQVAFGDLLGLGVDLNAFGTQIPRTLLMAAAFGGRNDLVSALAANGARIDIANEYGMTALYEAAALGRTATVQLLLDLGADFESETKGGYTPLMAASIQGECDVIQF